jgi:hypothetical protein
VLIYEGHVWWLVAVVGLMIVFAVIALFTRDAPASESAAPLVLSDEDRLALETMALKAKKRVQEERRTRRKAGGGKTDVGGRG